MAELDDDDSGKETLKYLNAVRRAVKLILSNEKFSLGLHPALYFYSSGGAFQPAASFNTLSWILDLEKRGKLDDFRKVRGGFESVIIDHPAVIKPATHRLGSGARTRSNMVSILSMLMDLLQKGATAESAWKSLSSEFPHLSQDEEDELDAKTKGRSGAKFSRGAKSAAFLAELAAVPRCALCGGLLHRNGKVADHAEERSKGGSSASRNARWVHPICNSNRAKTDC